MSQHISVHVNGKQRFFVLNTSMTILRFSNLLEAREGQPVQLTNMQFLHQPSDLPAVAELISLES